MAGVVYVSYLLTDDIKTEEFFCNGSDSTLLALASIRDAFNGS